MTPLVASGMFCTISARTADCRQPAKNRRCGAAPTALRVNPNSQTEPKCIPCATIDCHQLAAQPERTVPVPPHLVASGAARIHHLDII